MTPEEYEKALKSYLYYPPPNDYSPPTRCALCGMLIIFTNVVGGHMWVHLNLTDHDVVMRKEGWWDTATGKIRYGTGLNEILDLIRENQL